jgi:hypothetical protein
MATPQRSRPMCDPLGPAGAFVPAVTLPGSVERAVENCDHVPRIELELEMKVTGRTHPLEILRYTAIRPAPIFGRVRCFARLPGSRCSCTRNTTHCGPHVAHSFFKRIIAVWDDNPGSGLSTDRAYENEPPWSRMHFPFISHYAAWIVTHNLTSAPTEQELARALDFALCKIEHEPGDPQKRRLFVQDAIATGATEDDLAAATKLATSRISSPERLDVFTDEVRLMWKNPPIGEKVRLVVAKLIEVRFRPTDRAEYFAAMCRGDAP